MGSSSDFGEVLDGHFALVRTPWWFEYLSVGKLRGRRSRFYSFGQSACDKLDHLCAHLSRSVTSAYHGDEVRQRVFLGQVEESGLVHLDQAQETRPQVWHRYKALHNGRRYLFKVLLDQLICRAPLCSSDLHNLCVRACLDERIGMAKMQDKREQAGLLTALLFRAVSSLVVDFIAGIVYEGM